MKSARRGAGARARGADRAPRGRARRPPIGPPPLLRPRRMQSGRLQPSSAPCTRDPRRRPRRPQRQRQRPPRGRAPFTQGERRGTRTGGGRGSGGWGREGRAALLHPWVLSLIPAGTRAAQRGGEGPWALRPEAVGNRSGKSSSGRELETGQDWTNLTQAVCFLGPLGFFSFQVSAVFLQRYPRTDIAFCFDDVVLWLSFQGNRVRAFASVGSCGYAWRMGPRTFHRKVWTALRSSLSFPVHSVREQIHTLALGP